MKLQEAPSTETPRRDLCPIEKLIALPWVVSHWPVHSIQSPLPPLSYKPINDNGDNASLSPSAATGLFLPPGGKVCHVVCVSLPPPPPPPLPQEAVQDSLRP